MPEEVPVPRSRSARRATARAVAVTTAVTALALAPSAASAGVAFSVHQRSEAVVATWQVDDPRGTWVSVAAFDLVQQLLGGRPVADDVVSVSISQSFCDAAAGYQVDRSWDGSADADVTVDRARLSEGGFAPVTLTLSGTEWRTPLVGGDCQTPDWEGGYEAALSDLTLTLGAHLTATSRLLTDHTGSVEAVDGTRFVSTHAAQARLADVHLDAATTDARLPDLSALGDPVFAHVGRNVRTEVVVVHGRPTAPTP